MNKHDLAAAHRELLQRWLVIINDAKKLQENELERLLEQSPGQSVSPPLLKIPSPSSDMLNLLIGGIEKALDGNADPFGIKEPRGIKPKNNRQEMIAIVAFVISESQKHKAKGEKDPVTQAIGEAAERFNLSVDTVKKAHEDSDLVGLAKLQMAAAESNPAMAKYLTSQSAPRSKRK